MHAIYSRYQLWLSFSLSSTQISRQKDGSMPVQVATWSCNCYLELSAAASSSSCRIPVARRILRSRSHPCSGSFPLPKLVSWSYWPVIVAILSRSPESYSRWHIFLKLHQCFHRCQVCIFNEAIRTISSGGVRRSATVYLFKYRCSRLVESGGCIWQADLGVLQCWQDNKRGDGLYFLNLWTVISCLTSLFINKACIGKWFHVI